MKCWGTTPAKKIETGTQAKHRCVHARQMTCLCHVRAVVSFFLARVVFRQGSWARCRIWWSILLKAYVSDFFFTFISMLNVVLPVAHLRCRSTPVCVCCCCCCCWYIPAFVSLCSCSASVVSFISPRPRRPSTTSHAIFFATMSEHSSVLSMFCCRLVFFFFFFFEPCWWHSHFF